MISLFIVKISKKLTIGLRSRGHSKKIVSCRGEGGFLKSERKQISAGAYSETSQKIRMELSAEIVYVLKTNNYFRRKLYLRSLTRF